MAIAPVDTDDATDTYAIELRFIEHDPDRVRNFFHDRSSATTAPFGVRLALEHLLNCAGQRRAVWQFERRISFE